MYFLYSAQSNSTGYIGLTPVGELYGEATIRCSLDNSALASGCVTQKPPNCRNPDSHISLMNFQVGNMSEAGDKSEENENISLYDCAFKCLNNCSCVAYSSTTIDSTGCEMWGKGATFVSSSLGRVVYFIIDKHDPTRNKEEGESKSKVHSYEEMNKFWITTMAGGALFILISFYICYMMKRNGIKACKRLAHEKLSCETEAIAIPSTVICDKIEKASHEIQKFSLKTIVMVTDNFSSEHKLGEGGFGPVYKGKLLDGIEIAIKRLSTSSRQGFGVLLLEIVSGKKNGSCFHSDGDFLYLIGHAWQLWNEGRALQLIDPILDETCTATEILRCIHISLLCVQDKVEDRPTMADIVSFLSNDAALLVEPKEPAFFKSIALKGHGTPNNKQEKHSFNDETMTTMDGR
ncbi:hypothetical protein L6164_021546 [Bauhinia variegata]|nr:hypothetical protein L6164_021546 [Bauhinia variegata]